MMTFYDFFILFAEIVGLFIWFYVCYKSNNINKNFMIVTAVFVALGIAYLFILLGQLLSPFFWGEMMALAFFV